MVNQPFNRSEFMSLRNEKARIERDIFKQQNPSAEVPKYNEFLKKKSPITPNIVEYAVSYQVNYSGEYEDFKLPTQTFKVIGYKNSQHDIEMRTMNMVQTSKGVTSDNMFAPETAVMLDRELRVQSTPRGIEQMERDESLSTIENLKREVEELKTLAFGKYIVKDLDKSFKFKNRRGSTGEMKVDITNFL